MAGYEVDLERARAEREFRVNPPSSAPGQGDMADQEWDNIFNNPGTSSANDSALMGNTGGMDMNGMSDLNSILNPSPNPPVQPQPATSGGVEGFLEAGILGTGKFIKTLAKDVLALTKVLSFNSMVKTCGLYMYAGLGVTAGGFLLILFSWVAGGETSKAFSVTIGGLLSAFVGFATWWYTLAITRKNPDAFKSADEVAPEATEEFSDYSDVSFDTDRGSDNYDYSDDAQEEEDPWDGFDPDFDTDEDYDYGNDSSDEEVDTLSVDDALESLPEITKGTQTRSYLVETFLKVLPSYKPSFDTMREISDSSDMFINFEEWMRDSALQAGSKEENLPELTALRENAFIYQLIASRPTGMKEQEIADMIADVYSRDENGMVEKQGVYATVDSSVGVFRVNIFKGESVMISLGDVYKNLRDWINNPKVTMPMVWGINEMGKPLYCDAYDMFTLIISGVPRGGKSWKGQSFLAQLMMFSSPKEVNFYFFDPKGAQSDYEALSRLTPHCKGFTHDIHKIIPNLKQVIKKEEPFRRKLLEEADKINIKDFKKENPDVFMPYIYIVMDELQSMMDSFSKEEKQEFNSLVSILCSQLPNLGFRLVMFPHRIVNDIISKNIYELVSCRCIVKSQSFPEIQNAIGAQRKDFPYNLVNSGDMGIRTPDINKGAPSFCHSEVITNKNDSNKDIFRYIGEVWKRLEPDYAAGIYDSLIQSTTIKEKTTGGWLEKHVTEVGSKKKKKEEDISSAVVKDHSIGSDYQYTGGAFESNEPLMGMADLTEEALLEDDSDDERFWDEL